MSTTMNPYLERHDHSAWWFLYGLNPLSKLAAPLPAMVMILFTRDVATPLAFSLLAMLIILVGASLGPSWLFVLFVGVPALTLLMGFSFGLWAEPSRAADTPILFSLGDYHFYLGSFLIGLATALRLVSLVLLALIAGLTTTGPEMIRSLIQHLKVPYRIGYAALAAYRFVPRFGHELDVIKQAHRVRGMDAGRGPIAALRRNVGYVIPLLAGAIRHAERVALSMDSRAFGAYPTRTERHLVPFRVRDVVFILLFWALTIAIVLALPL